MINITITAETANELKDILFSLSGAPTTGEVTFIYEPPASEEKAPAEKPATRSRAKATPSTAGESLPASTTVVPAPEAAPNTATPGSDSVTFTGEPLATTTTETPAPVSNDLLDSPAPVPSIPASNGQASLLDTPTSVSGRKTDGIITLDLLRAKIAPIAQSNKQAIKDIIAQYVKADGQPCERPSDVQEKDYALVYNAIDFI